MFPIQMTFTVSTKDELARLIAAVGNVPAEISDTAKPDTKPAPEAAKPAGKPGKATPQAAPSQTAAASGAPPAATPATTEPTAASSTVLDYSKDVAPEFLKLIGAKGRDAGWKIITHFKPDAAAGTRLSAVVTPEQYAEVLELIKAAS